MPPPTDADARRADIRKALLQAWNEVNPLSPPLDLSKTLAEQGVTDQNWLRVLQRTREILNEKWKITLLPDIAPGDRTKTYSKPASRTVVFLDRKWFPNK
jgi:hypothetical protein